MMPYGFTILFSIKNIILSNENLILKGCIKVVDGKTRGVSDCGKFRLTVNNKYKYFDIPALYSVDDELYDSLENLVLTKKVSKTTLNSNSSLGYADSFTKEYKLINGEFVFRIKHIPNFIRPPLLKLIGGSRPSL